MNHQMSCTAKDSGTKHRVRPSGRMVVSRLTTVGGQQGPTGWPEDRRKRHRGLPHEDAGRSKMQRQEKKEQGLFEEVSWDSDYTDAPRHLWLITGSH